MISPCTTPKHVSASPDERDSAALSRWIDDGGFVPALTEEPGGESSPGGSLTGTNGFTASGTLHMVSPAGNGSGPLEPERIVARDINAGTESDSAAGAGTFGIPDLPDSRQSGAGNAPVLPYPDAGARVSKTRTRKRVLSALACPPALVAVSACHTVLALTYWIAFASTTNSLYLSVATSYSVVALISLWKVHETFLKDRRS